MALVFQCDAIQNARKYNQNWLEGKFNIPEKLRCFKWPSDLFQYLLQWKPELFISVINEERNQAWRACRYTYTQDTGTHASAPMHIH